MESNFDVVGRRGRLSAAWFAICLACLCSGCGEDPPVPGPTTLKPFVEAATPPPPSSMPTAPSSLPSVAGLWAGQLVLTSVTGGTGAVADAGARACVGDAIAGGSGINNSTLVITQNDRTITGRLTSADTGLAGSYAGSTSSTQLVLDTNKWDAASLNFKCTDSSGFVAQLTLVGSSIIATFPSVVEPSTLTGTAAHTFNVAVGPPGEEASFEGVVTKFSFTMTRR